MPSVALKECATFARCRAKGGGRGEDTQNMDGIWGIVKHNVVCSVVDMRMREGGGDGRIC
jgi:hypothetical protein